MRSGGVPSVHVRTTAVLGSSSSGFPGKRFTQATKLMDSPVPNTKLTPDIRMFRDNAYCLYHSQQV